MAEKIGVGIIGAGRIGQLHADNLLKNFSDDVSVVGISDPNVPAISGWATQRGLNLTPDSSSFLSNPAVQAILICSPTDLHPAQIIEAAAAGKAIFCEKPISFDLAQTQAALKAVEDAGVMLQIGFNRRFDPNVERAKKRIDDGEIGEVRSIMIFSGDPRPPSADYLARSGGIFFDMAIHDFDSARNFSGQEVETVSVSGSASSELFSDLGDVDRATTVLVFQNGAVCTIENNRSAGYYDQRVEISGSNSGRVLLDNVYPNTVRIVTAEGERRDPPVDFFLERYQESYNAELEAFFDALRTDRSPLVTGGDGWEAQRIAHAAGMSLGENRHVALSELKAS